MDYLISGDPVPGGMEPNEIHASPPREGAYSEGVEEYTVALRKDSKAKISKARASSRVAQRKFRENQKKRQAILEAKSQELEEAQEKRKSAEQQLERTEAEKVQLQFRVDRAEESCKVLQGVVKTLQKSHELLYGDTGGPRRGSNLLSSPATSQSGHEGRMAARQFSQPPAQFGKRVSWHPMTLLQS
ncbi:hypothetical protein N7448_011412 [Penicillium atrosanguineum]|uniref:BZIP domain-containing protein n=1 Tax=Penicillium atrosanguineum TaxID=1132637 RepID=A0A9W9U5V4_9EURO|nr:hypothetical protein N7526_011477 [Penicillium atrosanguineum]KAJ5117780.1 hypothetical protein N7448_011412 [Penicillium atrosanguineum]KAJ5318730.1 hypothetical protein N7476_005150 [Penicillium atrosanguineum]